MPCAGRVPRSWRGSVVIEECGNRAEIGETAGIERGRIERLDETLDQGRDATAADHVVSLPARDEQASVRESLDHGLAVARRGDRVELAFEHEHRLVAFDRFVEIRRSRAARPYLAGRAKRRAEFVAEQQPRV